MRVNYPYSYHSSIHLYQLYSTTIIGCKVWDAHSKNIIIFQEKGLSQQKTYLLKIL